MATEKKALASRKDSVGGYLTGRKKPPRQEPAVSAAWEGLAQTVLDRFPHAVIFVDKSGKVRYANRQSGVPFCHPDGNALRMGENVYDGVIPEQRAEIERAIRLSLTGSVVHVDRPLFADSEARDGWRFSFSPISVNGKRPTAVCVVALPVEPRKPLEDTLRDGRERLARLNECFLSFGPDPLENINRLTAFCGEALGATCALYNCLERGLLCSVGQWQTPPDFQAMDNPQGHLCHDVIQQASDRLFVVRDLDKTSYAQTDPNVMRYGLRTYAGQAVKLGPHVIGSLCVVFQRDYEPTEADQQLMGIVVTAVGIEEIRRRSQLALAESEGKFRSLVEQTSDVIWEVDDTGANTYVSPQVRHLLGYEPEELIGKPIAAFMDEENARRFANHMQERAVDQKTFRLYESRVRHRDGHDVDFEVSGVPRFRVDGSFAGFGGMARDITARRQAEEALRQKTSELEAIFGAFPDLLFHVTSDTTVLDYRGSATELYVSPEVFLGKKMVDFLPPDIGKQVRDAVRQVRQQQTIVAIEYALPIAGATRFYEARLVPFQNNEIILLVRNITERRIAEDALRLSEERFRAMFVESAVGMAIVDRDGEVIDVNPALERMLDYSREQIIKRGLRGVSHPDDVAADSALFHELRNGRRSHYSIEKRFIRSDGTVWWTQLTAFVVRDPQGGLRHVVRMFEDITARRQTEEALRESEERYRVLTEAAFDGIAVSVNAVLHAVSENFAQIFGYNNPDELRGKPIANLVAPPERERVTNYIASGYDKRYETICVRKDGRPFPVEVCGKTISQEGRTIRITAVRDITERKRAEQDVRDSERLLLESQSVAGLGSYVLDVVTGRWRSSAVLDKVFGIDEHFDRTFAGWLSLMHPEWREAMADYFANEVLAKRGRFDKEYKIIHPTTGAERWVHGLGELELDDQNRPVKMIGTIQDITERKRAEDALRESEARYRALAEAAFDDVVVTEKGVFVEGSEALADMVGYTTADMIGKSVLDFIVPEDRELVVRNMSSAYDKPYELRVVHRDGRTIPLEVCGRNIPYQGRTARISAVRDVSERHRLQEMLIARSHLDATAVLAGGVAHDVNNMMATILGNSELLAMQYPDRPEAIEMLKTISSTALKTGELAQQMLAFARGGKYQPQILNLNQAILQTLRLQEKLFPPRIRVNLELDPSLRKVEADSTQLRQVMVSLCANAVEAITTEGAITIRTRNVNLDDHELRSRGGLAGGPAVVVSVIDTGRGMSRETAARIFEPFFTTKSQGRGLGLSAAYGIVRNHGGTITVESDEGRGSCFEVYLPAVIEVVPSGQPSFSMPRGDETVLLIDPDTAVTSVTAALLRKLGYDAVAASSVAEAVHQVTRSGKRAGAVLLDVSLCESWESESAARNICPPTRILLTGGLSSEAVDHSIASGRAAGHVSKPYQMLDLANELRRVLDHR